MKSKRSGCFKVVLAVAGLLLLCLIVWGCFNIRRAPLPGQPAFLVSPETTFITEPLDENGDVDYLEAANRILSEGIAVENNAMVLLVQATGPDVDGKPIPNAFFERLGIERPPEKGNYLRHAYSWISRQAELEPAAEADEQAAESELIENESEDSGLDDDLMSFNSPLSYEDKLHRQYDFAMEYPWSSDELPEMGRYLDEMQEPLEIIRVASKRPRYYDPQVSDSDSMQLLNCWFEMRIEQREFIRLLSLSAMKNIHDGEIDQSVEDILSMYRLAHFVGAGNALIEQLLAYAFNGMADYRTVILAASGKATKQQLLDFRDELARIPKFGNLSRCMNYGDRFMGLDTMASIARNADEWSVFSGVGSVVEVPFFWFFIRTADWTEAARVMNDWYDRSVECAEIENLADRTAAFDLIDQEKKDLETKIHSARYLALTALGGRKAKGRLVGERFVLLMVPSLRGIESGRTRSESSRLMAQLALELAAYKTDHGKFPERLEQLVPDYTDKILHDTFTGAPFMYKPSASGDHFELYNFGANGVDDGGPEDSGFEDWGIDSKIKTWNEYRSELDE